MTPAADAPIYQLGHTCLTQLRIGLSETIKLAVGHLIRAAKPPRFTQNVTLAVIQNTFVSKTHHAPHPYKGHFLSQSQRGASLGVPPEPQLWPGDEPAGQVPPPGDPAAATSTQPAAAQW